MLHFRAAAPRALLHVAMVDDRFHTAGPPSATSPTCAATSRLNSKTP